MSAPNILVTNDSSNIHTHKCNLLIIIVYDGKWRRIKSLVEAK